MLIFLIICIILILSPFYISLGARHLFQPWLPMGSGEHPPWHLPRIPNKPLWWSAMCPDTYVSPRGKPHESISEECRSGRDWAGTDFKARRPLQSCARLVQQSFWLSFTWWVVSLRLEIPHGWAFTVFVVTAYCNLLFKWNHVEMQLGMLFFTPVSRKKNIFTFTHVCKICLINYIFSSLRIPLFSVQEFLEYIFHKILYWGGYAGKVRCCFNSYLQSLLQIY